ncbi:MAG: TVP38/TMEM64 family protein [Erysipelotrichaceae bacterium]|nr:TVP38/TMEM64 family protein [Erysipelotrichaceae bacterium]
MIELLKQWAALLTSVEFWIGVLEVFKDFGPVAPILLTCVESLIPALPLVVIVTFNVTAHGAVLGFLYSWIGTSIGCTIVFLFFRRIVKKYLQNWISRKPTFIKALRWVGSINGKALFVIAMMPFTPSVFVNLAFGLSDYDELKFLKVLISAKSIMMILLAFFGNSVASALNDPMYLILAGGILLILWWASKKVSEHNGL